jgi:multiple sugar transport system ATP-binding protein
MGRAIARNPAVFLFDEPLSNLDAKLRVEMRAEIKALHQRLKTTVVYVTHDQVEAMTLGDKIAVMLDGQVQQFGTPEDIYERPANLYVAGFIGSPSMNLVHSTVAQRGDRCGCALQAAQGAVWVDLGPANAALAVGAKVVLGIRPEHFHVAAPTDPDAFALRVDMVEPTGADTFVYGELGGTRTAVRVHPKHSRSLGGDCWLRLDASAVSVFDPDTRQRIALA